MAKKQKLSALHQRILDEGFQPLGMYSNSSFASQVETHTTPPFRTIVEDRHLAFRILPAYLVFDNAPKYYKNAHVIYVPIQDFKERIALIGRKHDANTDI